ncbi:hypothetical protein SISNIDRAFT_487302 [Sistotremastrum niveocremeum HHB9708]|nr:hypothetical protein SISNIDRAFT_487302 [Sistotremastrum niveocremeum HHB9708]
MADFKRIIMAHSFISSRKKTYLAQLSELASRNGVTLEWEEMSDGPDHHTIWQVYPIVNGQKWTMYIQAASNKKDAKEKSAEDVIMKLRGL